MTRIIIILMLALLFYPAVSRSAHTGEPGKNEISAEELLFLDIPMVVTAAKKEQPLPETAAAAYVITREDIRRSGMTTIPELLRLAPGTNVARIASDSWAISVRGFNDFSANELLVLIDGRSVYTPLFAGVNWDVLDLLLDDVERIEVIRGPGGALWGANAVNGVINIITRHARDSLGGLVTGGAGTLEKGEGAARFGGKLGKSANYRLYAKGFVRDKFDSSAGNDVHDAWDAARGGFRFDWAPTVADELMIQGDVYSGESGQDVTVPTLNPPGMTGLTETIDVSGGFGLARWRRVFSAESDMTLQGYFDREEREETILGQLIETWDLDLQHRFPLPGKQNITWGMGYRRVEDRLRNSFIVSFNPARRNTDLFSLFIQDEITLRDNLRLIIGSKFEHNDFTGFEYQPNLRALWKIRENQTAWAAVSRAVRTPPRSNSDIRLNVAAVPAGPGGLPVLIALEGSPAFRSEELLAFELGYRFRPGENLNLDFTAFYNIYDNLLTAEAVPVIVETDPSPPHLLAAGRFSNLMDGETYGVEIAAEWKVMRMWRLRAGYSWLKMRLSLDPASSDTGYDALVEGSSPEHQFQLHSFLDLPRGFELDAALYYVDQLPSLDVPAYTRFDLRIGWRPAASLELSLAGRNLLDNRHREFVTGRVNGGEVPRSVYGKVTWHF